MSASALIRPTVDLASRVVRESELRAAGIAYERAKRSYETARRARNAAIRRALTEGWEPIEIAETVGVSRQRAHQIIHAAKVARD